MLRYSFHLSVQDSAFYVAGPLQTSMYEIYTRDRLLSSRKCSVKARWVRQNRFSRNVLPAWNTFYSGHKAARSNDTRDTPAFTTLIVCNSYFSFGNVILIVNDNVSCGTKERISLLVKINSEWLVMRSKRKKKKKVRNICCCFTHLLKSLTRS